MNCYKEHSLYQNLVPVITQTKKPTKKNDATNKTNASTQDHVARPTKHKTQNSRKYSTLLKNFLVHLIYHVIKQYNYHHQLHMIKLWQGSHSFKNICCTWYVVTKFQVMLLLVNVEQLLHQLISYLLILDINYLCYINANKK